MKQQFTVKVCNAKKWLVGSILWAITMFLTGRVFAAGDLKSSKIATGTEKLISDATTWLMILAPTVGIVCIIYFLIRRSMSDEMDHKKWNTRITVALVSAVCAVLASVIVNLVIGYYK